MSDVFLKVGNKVHAAHKLILCAFSDVFQAMLMRREWAEWSESHVVLQELPQCEPVFHHFLEYFYTGKILITHTNVMGILCLADKYIVKSLTRLCTEYMCQHISHAASHNVLFSWLQYTISCNHEEAALKCMNYVKWNLESVANTPEFGDFDAELFSTVLQQNDLVVYNEMVLFNFVLRWLDLQKIAMLNSGLPRDEIQKHMKHLVEAIMSHIRFPMMTPRELADLLLSPLIKEHKEFFVDRMAIGMIFHAGQTDRLKSLCATEEGQRLLTPRLYTCDNFSAIMLIENVLSLPNYHTNTFVFYSNMSAADCESDKLYEWVVDLYPRGVWFKRCYLIVWQGILEVPEEILKTVRLSLSFRGQIDEGASMKVRVGILIYAKQGGIESIYNVIERNHHFTEQDRLLNIDNFIPFEEFNASAADSVAWPFPAGTTGISEDSESSTQNAKTSRYLIGPNCDQLKINIVITPRCPDYGGNGHLVSDTTSNPYTLIDT